VGSDWGVLVGIDTRRRGEKKDKMQKSSTTKKKVLKERGKDDRKIRKVWEVFRGKQECQVSAKTEIGGTES